MDGDTVAILIKIRALPDTKDPWNMHDVYNDKCLPQI